MGCCACSQGTPPIKTIIVVTHGIALRAFVKMWCHKSHDWYEGEWNPNNCAVRLITQTSGDEGYIFNGYDTHDPSKPAVSPYAFSMKQV
jgi:broad specificity phosphatase PhoE